MQAIKASILNAPAKMRGPLSNSLKSNYQFNPLVGQFTNLLMKDGLKQKALKLFLGALKHIENNSNADPFTVVENAIRNAQPMVGLKKKKMRNKIELQPRPLQEKQGKRLAILWIIKESAKQKEKTFVERLGAELMAAANNKSESINRKIKLQEEAIKCRSTLSRLIRFNPSPTANK